MQKIVINSCFGGFGLSPEAATMLAHLQRKKLYFYEQTKYSWHDKVDEYTRVDRPSGSFYYTFTKDLGKVTDELESAIWWNETDIPRDDPNLIRVVEVLGEKANTPVSKLKIVEIPDGVKWVIEEYDGSEHIAEEHRTWG